VTVSVNHAKSADLIGVAPSVLRFALPAQPVDATPAISASRLADFFIA